MFRFISKVPIILRLGSPLNPFRNHNAIAASSSYRNAFSSTASPGLGGAQSKQKTTEKEKTVYNDVVIEAGKRSLPQSALKMKFLVTLIRDAWVPDAIAQLKFSPKHRAIDVKKIVERAVALARIYHGAIPEELYIKEVMVTKGSQQKRMRIMGRGRTGVGYKRQSHVCVKVAFVNFEDRIKKGFADQRKLWMVRYKKMTAAKNKMKNLNQIKE